MPRVPTVNGPSVADAPLQASMQRSSVSPGMLQNNQLEQLGKAMTDAGALIQERTDADLLMRAETDIKARYLEWEGEAKQRRGQQAWGVAKEAGEWWDREAAKAAEAIGSERAKALFQREATKMRGLSVGAFAGYEAGQRRESLDQSAQASIVGSINLAAANAQDPAVLATAKADILKRNEARAKINGWGPEQAAAARGEYLTNLHTQVLQSLARDFPDQAEAYYKANEQEIDGSRRAEVGAFAAKATATRLADTTAEAAWQALGPKSDRDPVQLDVLEARIRKDLAGKDEAIKLAIAGVRERAVAFKDSRRERDDQLEASVNQAILDGASPSAIRRMPAFMQLSPESARKISDFLDNRALRGEQLAAAREGRAAAAEAREQGRLTRQGMGAYLVYSNPDTLAGMSEAQVLNLLPTLGNELTSHLMQQKRALTGNAGKLAEARMDTEDFNHVARSMSMPVDAKATPEQKEMLGELKYRVEQRIAAVQQANGKPLARNEKMELMRQEMARTVTVNGFWSDREVPVIGLTAKQVQDVVIPKADRQQLADAMRTMYQRTGAKQYEPTDDNLRRFYLLSKSPSAALILPPKN